MASRTQPGHLGRDGPVAERGEDEAPSTGPLNRALTSPGNRRQSSRGHRDRRHDGADSAGSSAARRQPEPAGTIVAPDARHRAALGGRRRGSNLLASLAAGRRWPDWDCGSPDEPAVALPLPVSRESDHSSRATGSRTPGQTSRPRIPCAAGRPRLTTDIGGRIRHIWSSVRRRSGVDPGRGLPGMGQRHRRARAPRVDQPVARGESAEQVRREAANRRSPKLPPLGRERGPGPRGRSDIVDVEADRASDLVGRGAARRQREDQRRSAP